MIMNLPRKQGKSVANKLFQTYNLTKMVQDGTVFKSDSSNMALKQLMDNNLSLVDSIKAMELVGMVDLTEQANWALISSRLIKANFSDLEKYFQQGYIINKIVIDDLS